MSKHYVVYYYERLQDGHEEGAKVHSSLEDALATATKWRSGFNADNMTIKLFELGKEVELEQVVTEEAVVTKKEKYGFKVKGKK